VKHEAGERICEFPGGRSEAAWLDTFEYLRSCLSDALSTEVHFGCYWIDDFPGHASAGGCARVRGQNRVPEIESDNWEGVLGWSGNRGECGHSSALIFPFLKESAVMRRGRIADLASDDEVDEFVVYRFHEGKFIDSGWSFAEGPGEWAHVTVPGTVYFQRLRAILHSQVIAENSPIMVDLHIPQFYSARANTSPPRISLVHVNRNREHTNLVPQTSRPPRPGSRDVQSLADCSSPSPDIVRVRLDSFRIRGGWTPGKYHISVRIQNFHKPGEWTWTCDISEPLKLTIV